LKMIDSQEIKDRVQELAANVAEDEQVELVSIAILGAGKKKLVKVIIDKEGGVSISDCERMSRGLETLLDVEDIFPIAYMLEVSSPGLDRPLTQMRDFERSVGKLAKVITSEKVGNDTIFIGRIIDTGDNWIRLRFEEKPLKGRMPKKKPDEEHNDVFIPFEKISRARLEIEQ
jgi:ribosome maturation factor RimP